MTNNADKAIQLGHPSYVWRFGQDRRLEMIRRYADLDGKRVLDIGCGIGAYVRKLTPLSELAVGIDLDPEKVTEAHEKLPYVCASASEELPFADGNFDAVLLHEIIEHVGDDRQTVREACRVLKPGGRMIIFAPNRLYPFETHGAYLRGHYRYGNIPLVNYAPDRWRQRFCPHVRAYTRGDMRRLVAGLPCTTVALTQVYPGYDNIAARRPKLAAILRGMTYLFERTPLRAFGLSHFMVLEKE